MNSTSATEQGVYEAVNSHPESYYSSVAIDDSSQEISIGYSDARALDQSSRNKRRPPKTFPKRLNAKSRSRQNTADNSSYETVTPNDTDTGEEYAYASPNGSSIARGQLSAKLQQGVYEIDESLVNARTLQAGEYEFEDSVRSVEIEDSFESSGDVGFAPYLNGCEYSYATVDRQVKPVSKT